MLYEVRIKNGEYAVVDLCTGEVKGSFHKLSIAANTAKQLSQKRQPIKLKGKALALRCSACDDFLIDCTC